MVTFSSLFLQTPDQANLFCSRNSINFIFTELQISLHKVITKSKRAKERKMARLFKKGAQINLYYIPVVPPKLGNERVGEMDGWNMWNCVVRLRSSVPGVNSTPSECFMPFIASSVRTNMESIFLRC